MRNVDFIELQYVHPLLSAITISAARSYTAVLPDRRIRVTEGYRTAARQQLLVQQKKSWTLASEHLYGLAVDLAVILKPTIKMNAESASWAFDKYREVNGFMQKQAAVILAPYPQARLVWGGDWTQRDGVHWELEGIESTMPSINMDVLRTS